MGGSDCTRYMYLGSNAQYDGRFGNTVVILLRQLHELLDIVFRSPYFRIIGTCSSFWEFLIMGPLRKQLCNCHLDSC